MADSSKTVNMQACVAEYVAMTLFVIIGCGSATGIANAPDSAWLLQVSLTFGFAITSLAYAIGHLSGGHINCAVTLGLVLTKNCELHQGVANLIAQVSGSLTGALLLCAMVQPEGDRTGSLGSNVVSDDFTWFSAFLGEVMMTFLLVFVVLQTACNPESASNRPQACIAIGFAVFLAHTVLIPIDGCSINPTRSLGPALVAQIRYPNSRSMKDIWIFWSAPFIGAALAAGVYELGRTMSADLASKAGAADLESIDISGTFVETAPVAPFPNMTPIVPDRTQRAPPVAAGSDNQDDAAEGGGFACCMFFKTALIS